LLGISTHDSPDSTVVDDGGYPVERPVFDGLAR